MKIYIKYIILYFILFKIYQHSWCIQANSDQPTGMRKLPKVKEVKAEFKHNTYKNKYITLTKNKYTSQLTNAIVDWKRSMVYKTKMLITEKVEKRAEMKDIF